MKGRKMISAVNSCNPVIQTKPIQFKGEQIQTEPTKKEGMSTTTKALLGLGALAAIVAGGLLIKKRVDANEVKTIVRDFALPENFQFKSADELLKSVSDIDLCDKKSMVEFLEKCAPEFQSKSGDVVNLCVINHRKFEGFSNAVKIDYTKLPKDTFIAFFVDNKNNPFGSMALVKPNNLLDESGSKLLDTVIDDKIYKKPIHFQ